MIDPDSSTPPWLDDDRPHEDEHSRAQIAGVADLLAPSAKRVLDLGCGAGRVLVPLAGAGHAVVGVDRRRDALARCRARLCGPGGPASPGRDRGSAVELLAADFHAPWRFARHPFDAVLCLGNTLMTVTDVAAAATLLRRAREALGPGGIFVTDDCPRAFWPEVTGGRWQAGVSPDGAWELAWEETDAVFTLLETDRGADPARERRFRLWTDGALRLVAGAAGLSGPERLIASHLLVMRKERSTGGR